jgi:hypothetical protein
MKLMYPTVGIILMFSWCIYLLNSQREEIQHWKLQAQIAVHHQNETNHALNECKSDVEFLRNGVDELMESCNVTKLNRAIKASALPPMEVER